METVEANSAQTGNLKGIIRPGEVLGAELTRVEFSLAVALIRKEDPVVFPHLEGNGVSAMLWNSSTLSNITNSTSLIRSSPDPSPDPSGAINAVWFHMKTY